MRILSSFFLVTGLSSTGGAVELPWMRVTIAPQFDGREQAVAALNMTLQLNDAKSTAGRPLLTLALNHGLTPTLRYDGDALSAADDSGPLPLSYTDTNDTDAQRTWVSTRDPAGEIVVRFLAEPRKTDAQTPSGPRIDLRDDQGGVVGMGAGFIPYPPAEEEWDVRVRWVVPESAPAGTHFASSVGDERDSSAVGLPSRIIAKAYFAVGPLQRWPARDNASTNASYTRRRNDAQQDFDMYWMGNLPYDEGSVAETTKRVFLAISEFFGDDESSFRLFWRRAWAGYGGAGGYQSFLLEYSEGTEEEQSEDALKFLLSHEMIHEYALMYPTRQFDMWYREGVAQYYGAVAPFSGGATDREYFVRWLNNNAQAYYTSSTVDMEWQDILDNYWTGVEVVKTPYSRGFIYLAQVQGLIAEATGGEKDLDDIVLELYRLFLAVEKCQSEEFVGLLSDIIGKESAEASYEGMLNGTLIVPHADGFAKFGLKMVRRDAGKLELGYTSIGSNVTTVVQGSRAEEAGLMVGDQVVRAWALWGAGDALENMMRVVVMRDGEEVVIEYVPRSYEKVENWMWVDAGEGDASRR